MAGQSLQAGPRGLLQTLVKVRMRAPPTHHETTGYASQLAAQALTRLSESAALLPVRSTSTLRLVLQQAQHWRYRRRRQRPRLQPKSQTADPEGMPHPVRAWRAAGRRQLGCPLLRFRFR
jgi:hypothetical protein